MAEFTHNNEDWELHACLDWRRKWKTVVCYHCSVSGKEPLGWRDYGDDTTCTKCRGRGTREELSTSPMPDMTPALIEHMRRAWWDYFNPTAAREKASRHSFGFDLSWLEHDHTGVIQIGQPTKGAE